MRFFFILLKIRGAQRERLEATQQLQKAAWQRDVFSSALCGKQWTGMTGSKGKGEGGIGTGNQENRIFIAEQEHAGSDLLLHPQRV